MCFDEPELDEQNMSIDRLRAELAEAEQEIACFKQVHLGYGI